MLFSFSIDRIYKEKQSGKDFSRPVYQEMRSKMRFGDVLVVHDLSRFGRNKEEIRNEWEEYDEYFLAGNQVDNVEVLTRTTEEDTEKLIFTRCVIDTVKE